MFSRLLACAIPSETGWQKVGVGSWSLLAVWSGIPQWLEWSSAGREEKRRCTHEYMWKTLCDNITYWTQNYILLKIEWFEDCNGRHMDGCGERPHMGKFDLVAFTCARADRIIIASTNTQIRRQRQLQMQYYTTQLALRDKTWHKHHNTHRRYAALKKTCLVPYQTDIYLTPVKLGSVKKKITNFYLSCSLLYHLLTDW